MEKNILHCVIIKIYKPENNRTVEFKGSFLKHAGIMKG